MMLKQPDATVCAFRLDPNQVEVDAGGSFSLHATITCADQREPAGLELVVCGPDGQEVGRGTCSRCEDGRFGLLIENVLAPATPGIFTHTLRPANADDRSVDIQSEKLAVIVRPHLTRVTVWDVPPALRPGEQFTFMVGVKCSSSCCLEGRAVRVTDEAGAQVVIERLGSDIWPGTEGLHVARVQAIAPRVTGSHEWRITSPSRLDGVAHESGSCRMRVTVTNSLECAVELEVIEFATEQALSRATVVLHPFRAVTDDAGIARLRVAKGEYDLLVSCSGHTPSALRRAITSDERIRIVLEPEGLWTPVEEA